MKSVFSFLFSLLCYVAIAQFPAFNNTEIIYGRKDGMALTMQVLSPKQGSNGKAIVSVVSGNWRSSLDDANASIGRAAIYLQRGYTVFNVIHGSQPRYTIADAGNDIKRAIRFIRYNAKQYHIDPAHIGITGGSSAGHLSLLVATADDKPDAAAKDPIDRVSSRVQAVAVFYPPTDFLNYGQLNFNAGMDEKVLASFGVAAAFDFKTWDQSLKKYVPVSTQVKLQLAKQYSPIYAVTNDDPPVLIIHGDQDNTVPLQQSESIVKKLKQANVPNELIIKKGGQHGWPQEEVDEKKFIDWFDKYLR